MQNSIVVPVVRGTENPLPAYETPGCAGMDLRAHLDQPLVLAPGDRTLVPTGLRLEIPRGYEAQVRPRSGLALKRGLAVLNAPGTIGATSASSWSTCPGRSRSSNQETGSPN